MRVEHNNGRGYFVSDRFVPVRDESGEVREFDSELAALDYIAAASAPATPADPGTLLLFAPWEYEQCPACDSGPSVWGVTVVRDGSGEIVGCTDCYRNDECPAGCMTPHPGPDAGDDPWECPATGITFRWCGDCEEHYDPTGAPNGAEVHGYWYCDPWEHGWDRCNDCDRWISDDDAWGCGDCEVTSCRSCHSAHHDHQDEDYPDPDDDDDRGWTEVPRCDHCDAARPLTHVDPMDESALCSECATSPTHVLVAA